MKAAEQLRDQFVSSDQSSMQELIMRACSASLGWVEKQPGQCHAGGPPPICPVDHWKKDPIAAVDARDKFDRSSKEDRTEQIRQAACSCWMGQISGADAMASPTVSSHTPANHPAASAPSTFIIPCSSDEECDVGAPGYHCEQKICRPHTIGSGLPVDEFIGQSFDHLADEYSKSIPGGGAIKLFFDILMPSGMGTWSDIYRSNAMQIDSRVVRLRHDYRLLAEYNKTSDYWGPSRITLLDEVADLDDEIRYNIAKMKEAAFGMKTDGELGLYGCPDVFDQVRSKLIRSTQAILDAQPKNQ
jgi:hypothetical protein